MQGGDAMSSESREPALLWEWIRAATESAISPHISVIGVPGDFGEIRLNLYRCFVDITEDLTLPEVYTAWVRPMSGPAVHVYSPAALSAELDRLAHRGGT